VAQKLMFVLGEIPPLLCANFELTRHLAENVQWEME
jgi:hypothetical protein